MMNYEERDTAIEALESSCSDEGNYRYSTLNLPLCELF